jgi:four helix bundle protein
MNPPETFEDLNAWKAARELTTIVYAFCRREPLMRGYGLIDQLRRAAVSVMNNIAEGWESHRVAKKMRFDSFVRRSGGEVRSMSYVLTDNNFVNETEHHTLRKCCNCSGQLITSLIRLIQQERRTPELPSPLSDFRRRSPNSNLQTLATTLQFPKSAL